MTNRLLLNAGTPQAWEIQLRPGLNRIGRGEHNDFVIPDPSVSGSHCEITVSPSGVLLKDLGSTNGTFVGGSRVQETVLRSGQAVRLGHVEMLFETVGAPAVRVTTSLPPTSPALAPVASIAPAPAAPAIRVSKPGLSVARPATPVAVVAVPEAATPTVVSVAGHAQGGPPPRDMGTQFCRFHKTIHAHFHCDHCKKSFCDLCVNTKQEGDYLSHTCRACGKECVPLMLRKPKVIKQGFFSSLPGAFVYPFRGSGVFVIIIATVLFGLLNWYSPRMLYGVIPIITGWHTIALYVLKVIVVGYLFSFMQNIIQATAVGESELPDLPSMADFASDILMPALEFLGLVVFCFGPALLALMVGIFQQQPIAIMLAIPLALIGGFYFPMAFLAVTILNSILAVNPLFVVSSILRIPLAYVTAAVLLIGVYVFRHAGGAVMDYFFARSLGTESMAEFLTMVVLRALWGLLSFYLMIVAIRILGLLYFHNKDKLGWLARK